MAYQFQAAPTDRFSIGRVFSRAFAAIIANPGAALGTALLFGGQPLIGCHYLEHRFATTSMTTGQAGLPQGFWLAIFISLAISVLSAAVNVVAQGAFVPLVAAEEAEGPAEFADAARAGFGALLPLIVLGVVMSVGTTIASLFVIIPGIILMLTWSVAGPALVAERCGIRAALGRSRELTLGARGGIFALMIVVGGVMLAVGALVDQLTAGFYGDAAFTHLFEQGFPAVYVLVKAVADTLVTVFAAAMYAALYVELRHWKDGAPANALAEVFA
jgi:hypothetical protein